MNNNTKSVIPALVLAMCVCYLAVGVAQWLSGEHHLGRIVSAIAGIAAAVYLCVKAYGGK